MDSDPTMASMLGYLSGMLWNQNNVDPTTSPVTTALEIEVGKQLCSLLGYTEGNVTSVFVQPLIRTYQPISY